jgi:hypothetical protein
VLGGRWENAPEAEHGGWEYYEHWVTALAKMIDDHYLLPPRNANGDSQD